MQAAQHFVTGRLLHSPQESMWIGTESFPVARLTLKLMQTSDMTVFLQQPGDSGLTNHRKEDPDLIPEHTGEQGVVQAAHHRIASRLLHNPLQLWHNKHPVILFTKSNSVVFLKTCHC